MKSFHDDSPVLLAAVEFVMETFDWRPPEFYFRIWKKIVDGARVADNRCKSNNDYSCYESNQIFWTINRNSWADNHLLGFDVGVVPTFQLRFLQD